MSPRRIYLAVVIVAFVAMLFVRGNSPATWFDVLGGVLIGLGYAAVGIVERRRRRSLREQRS